MTTCQLSDIDKFIGFSIGTIMGLSFGTLVIIGLFSFIPSLGEVINMPTAIAGVVIGTIFVLLTSGFMYKLDN